MTGTLFEPEHKCPGPWCRYCETRTGTEAKKAAIKAVRDATDDEWDRRAQQWIIEVGRGQTFTADDLVEAIGLPVGSSNQIGAFFHWLSMAYIIKYHGYATSKRASNHGRLIREWEST